LSNRTYILVQSSIQIKLSVGRKVKSHLSSGEFNFTRLSGLNENLDLPFVSTNLMHFAR